MHPDTLCNCFILFCRVLRQVQAIAVILTSIENNDEGGIDLIMYVELSDGMVLNQQALLQAVEVC